MISVPKITAEQIATLDWYDANNHYNYDKNSPIHDRKDLYTKETRRITMAITYYKDRSTGPHREYYVDGRPMGFDPVHAAWFLSQPPELSLDELKYLRALAHYSEPPKRSDFHPTLPDEQRQTFIYLAKKDVVRLRKDETGLYVEFTELGRSLYDGFMTACGQA